VQGRRNFVVAANGYTKVFSKSGKQVKSFPSNLPGGNRNQVSSQQYIVHTHKTTSVPVLRIYACAYPDRVHESQTNTFSWFRIRIRDPVPF
jgi:hypothetical protein